MAKNQYTVNILFTKNGEEVLLRRKNNQLNGIMGEIKRGELGAPLRSAIREIKENTGASLADLVWLGTMKSPAYLPPEQTEDTVILFYAGTVNAKSEVSPQSNKQDELVWLTTRDVLSSFINDPKYAGNGDLILFINKAVLTLFPYKYKKVGVPCRLFTNKELIDIILTKYEKRERMGYDHLNDSDIMDILEECERRNITITREELEQLGMN